MHTVQIAAAMMIVAAGAGAASAQQLYGVASYGPFSVQSLYSINPESGEASLIGSTGVTNINGIAWDDSRDTLYAYTSDADLYSLNLFTGAATRLAQRAATVPEGDIAVSASGAAYANSSTALGTLDLSTGVFAPLGPIGAAGTDVSGLAFDGAGTLWGYAKNGAAQDAVLTFDLITGAATLMGQTGLWSVSSVGGLAFEPLTSTLYLTDGDALFTVNTTTGAATLVGDHGSVTGFSGLAIPGPGAAGLLGLGALAAARRRR